MVRYEVLQTFALLRNQWLQNAPRAKVNYNPEQLWRTKRSEVGIRASVDANSKWLPVIDSFIICLELYTNSQWNVYSYRFAFIRLDSLIYNPSKLR